MPPSRSGPDANRIRHVYSHLNCAVQMPVWGEQDESVEGCCCSVGNVQARLTLAKTGYVPGEPITYTVDIFNKCDSTIERVELELKQVGGENIDNNNRELIERFQNLKALYNLKEKHAVHKYQWLYKSVVYKRTKHTKINKHLHTKHGKNACTQNHVHTLFKSSRRGFWHDSEWVTALLFSLLFPLG